VTDYHLYAVSVACPVCDEVTQFVETTSDPVALDQDVPLSNASHCPACGVDFQAAGAEWDLRDEHEIETVLPAEERGQA